MKRPVLIVGPMPPPYSGPEIHTQNIMNSAILKSSFTLYNLNIQKHKTNEGKGNPTIRGYLLELLHVLRFIFIGITVRPRIVFIPLSQLDLGFCRDAALFTLGNLFGMKTALYLPGGAYDVFFKTTSFPRLVKWVFQKADAIMVLSEEVRRQVLSILKTHEREKVTILPLDTELEKSSGRYDEKKDNCLWVLHLGHISVPKGALDLVKAIPAVVSRVPNVRFLFAGEFLNRVTNVAFIPDPHNAEKKIKEFIKKENIREYVQFLGPVFGGDKTSLLKNADIMVLASYSEGGPRSVFEGMLAGCPVVVSPVGCLKEIIEDGINGFFVKPGQPAEIAERIIRLLEDDELRSAMGTRNEELVTKHYSPEVKFAALRSIFEELVHYR